MTAATIVLGVLAQVIAWWFVASGRASVWVGLGPVLAILGVAAVAVGAPSLTGSVVVATAAAAGIVAGVVLYLGTAAFVAIVGDRWAAFGRDARAIYRHGHAAAFAVGSAAAVAVGEELFWRGLTQPELASRLGAASAGALVGWLAYVAVNAVGRNLAILAGAVVGGAAWSGLAWWSGGVLASVLAHGVWTALMLARPVIEEGEA